jgi:hypothetical protein
MKTAKRTSSTGPWLATDVVWCDPALPEAPKATLGLRGQLGRCDVWIPFGSIRLDVSWSLRSGSELWESVAISTPSHRPTRRAALIRIAAALKDEEVDAAASRTNLLPHRDSDDPDSDIGAEQMVELLALVRERVRDKVARDLVDDLDKTIRTHHKLPGGAKL